MKRFKDILPGDPIWMVSKTKMNVAHLYKLKADGMITQVYTGYELSMEGGLECICFGEETALGSLAYVSGGRIFFCDEEELLQWIGREEDRVIDWITNFNRWEDLATAEEMFNKLYEEIS